MWLVFKVLKSAKTASRYDTKCLAVCYSSSELRGEVHPIRVISEKTVKTV